MYLNYKEFYACLKKKNSAQGRIFPGNTSQSLLQEDQTHLNSRGA